MPGRTESFNQRIVKVVIPTLEAKAEWAQAAAREGYPENVSGWVRNVVAKHLGEDTKRLTEEAGQAQSLARRTKELDSELRLLRDAYEKAKGDLLNISKRYEELASRHAAWVAEAEATRARKAAGLMGPMGEEATLEAAKRPRRPHPSPEEQESHRAGKKRAARRE